MPRQKRINIAGTLHHVIVRGLDGKKLFKDDIDRKEILRRLEKALKETKSLCYAWALMSNHFHLVIRTGTKSLSELMRKILTGYAIYFNKKNKRKGYVYQNRYKSILCQEDVYLLELVRYIHLNPVRAKVVKDIRELNEYLWTGHSVLTGNKKNEWQSTEEVLGLFDTKKKTAIKKYIEFVKDGIKIGKRPELTGGGMIRSAGGWEEIKKLKREKEKWRGDERILGDSEFVTAVLNEAEEEINKKEKFKRAGWNLKKIIWKVCKELEIKEKELRKKGRENNISKAKAIICYLGYNELGMNGKELARYFNISRPSISKLINPGEELIKTIDIKLIN